MSRRWERALLVFSLALNAAFVSLAAVYRRAEPAPAQIEPPRERFPPRWQRRRAAFLGHRLGLDREQRAAIHERLGTMGPAFVTAREDLVTTRHEFFAALQRNDLAAARAARQRLSTAQARLDSLSAEAMLREMEHLHGDQREQYLRWMSRPMRRGHPRGGPPPELHD